MRRLTFFLAFALLFMSHGSAISQQLDSLYTISGRINGREYVDLGLSVKWATCNIGAKNPFAEGHYFAWGETVPKMDYSWETYKFRLSGDSDETIQLSKYNSSKKRGVVDKRKVLMKEDDAASVNWGGDWRMPTPKEWGELFEKCDWEYLDTLGIAGWKITSSINGNSAFIPFSGSRTGESKYYHGVFESELWSSMISPEDSGEAIYANYESLIYDLDSWEIDWFSFQRYQGLPIRAVVPRNARDDEMDVNPEVSFSAKLSTTEPTGLLRGHGYVDLGLSVYWADCNIGAEFPYEPGDYFGYLDTLAYKPFSKNTLHFPMDSVSNAYDRLKLKPAYDTAHLKWEGFWRTPTWDDFKELRDKCNWEWIERDGIFGYFITSKINGSSVFLPAAGMSDQFHWMSIYYRQTGYWLSSRSYCIYSFSDKSLFELVWRWPSGRSMPIRPVLDKSIFCKDFIPDSCMLCGGKLSRVIYEEDDYKCQQCGEGYVIDEALENDLGNLMFELRDFVFPINKCGIPKGHIIQTCRRGPLNNWICEIWFEEYGEKEYRESRITHYYYDYIERAMRNGNRYASLQGSDGLYHDKYVEKGRRWVWEYYIAKDSLVRKKGRHPDTKNNYKSNPDIDFLNLVPEYLSEHRLEFVNETELLGLPVKVYRQWKDSKSGLDVFTTYYVCKGYPLKVDITVGTHTEEVITPVLVETDIDIDPALFDVREFAKTPIVPRKD